MKLITKPESSRTKGGGIAISDAYIWVPSSEQERVFEKLRTGKNDPKMIIGKRFNFLVFPSSKLTLYDVEVVEAVDTDTYRCTVDKFGIHR